MTIMNATEHKIGDLCITIFCNSKTSIETH